MIVTELNISNFRGIENLSFVPNPKLNLFMGSNGTGKTSILKSLSILLSWMVARIRVQKGKVFWLIWTIYELEAVVVI